MKKKAPKYQSPTLKDAIKRILIAGGYNIEPGWTLNDAENIKKLDKLSSLLEAIF